MGKVTIFQRENQEINISKEILSKLELLNMDVIIDFKLEEIQFFYPNGEVFVIDFDENLEINELKDFSFDDNLVNDVEDDYFEELEKFQNNLNTDAFVYGMGYYQNFLIKIYDKYIIFRNILIDLNDFDFDPDPDPDDGEPLPVLSGESFFANFIITG